MLILIAFFLFFTKVKTETVLYVREPGQTYGSGDGSDWDNALSNLPDEYTDRSTTVYIASGFYAGEIDSSHSIVFDVEREYRGSEYVRILKATEYDHGTSIGWESGFAEQAILPKLFIRSSNVIVDGREKYLFKIESRRCVSEEQGRTTAPIYVRGPYVEDYEFTIKNLEIRNTEIQHCGLVGEMTGQAFDIFYSAWHVSDILIENNYWHDTNRAHVTIVDGDNINILNNIFDNAGNHQEAGAFGIIGTDITFANNIVTNSKNVFLSLGRDTTRNLYVYNNVFTMTPDWEWSVYNLVDAGNQNVFNGYVNHNTIANIRGLHLGIRASDISDIKHYNNIYFNNSCNAIILGSEVSHNYNWLYQNFRVDGETPKNIDEYLSESNQEIGTENIFTDSNNNDFSLISGTENGFFLGLPFQTDIEGNDRCHNTKGAYEWDPDGICQPYNPSSAAVAVAISIVCFSIVLFIIAITIIILGVFLLPKLLKKN